LYKGSLLLLRSSNAFPDVFPLGERLSGQALKIK
jgi:hypothetical protein